MAQTATSAATTDLKKAEPDRSPASSMIPAGMQMNVETLQRLASSAQHLLPPPPHPPPPHPLFDRLAASLPPGAAAFAPFLGFPPDLKGPETAVMFGGPHPAMGGPPPVGLGPFEPAFGPAVAYPYHRNPFDLNGSRRKNATRETTAALKAWLYEHRKNPYPTKGEKIMLALITNMSLTQVSTWFANARRRLKKENKMTWSPRNRPGDEDNLDDVDVDNRPSSSVSDRSDPPSTAPPPHALLPPPPHTAPTFQSAGPTQQQLTSSTVETTSNGPTSPVLKKTKIWSIAETVGEKEPAATSNTSPKSDTQQAAARESEALPSLSQQPASAPIVSAPLQLPFGPFASQHQMVMAAAGLIRPPMGGQPPLLFARTPMVVGHQPPLALLHNPLLFASQQQQLQMQQLMQQRLQQHQQVAAATSALAAAAEAADELAQRREQAETAPITGSSPVCTTTATQLKAQDA